MPIVVEIADRRAAVRAEVMVRALVTELPKPGLFPGDEEILLPTSAVLRHVCEHGLVLEAEEPICPGRTVKLVLFAPVGTLSVLGRVRATLRREDGSAWLAIAPEALNAEERALLAAVVGAQPVAITHA